MPHMTYTHTYATYVTYVTYIAAGGHIETGWRRSWPSSHFSFSQGLAVQACACNASGKQERIEHRTIRLRPRPFPTCTPMTNVITVGQLPV